MNMCREKKHKSKLKLINKNINAAELLYRIKVLVCPNFHSHLRHSSALNA